MVLALYGVNVIRTRLVAHGIHYSWATLCHKLVRWQRASTALTTTGGSRIEVRCDISPDPAVAAFARAAGTPYASETGIRRLAKRKEYQPFRAISLTLECSAVTGLLVWSNRRISTICKIQIVENAGQVVKVSRETMPNGRPNLSFILSAQLAQTIAGGYGDKVGVTPIE